MVGDTPLVSVIMPVYNGEKYVKQALDSVFTQDYPTFEIIIIDDGSSDNTAQIIGQYGDVQYIYQDNQGVASARNAGIAASNGEIIAFLDSDDFWPPNMLSVTVRYFQKHPEVGYVLGKQVMFVESGCTVPQWVNEWLKKPHDAWNTAVLVALREAIERVGLFNKDYLIGEDTEWFVRASEAGVQWARLPDKVLYRRIHGGNLSIQMKQMQNECLLRIARESIHRQQARNNKSPRE